MAHLKVKYIGDEIPYLRGQTALARPSEDDDSLLVQFDDLSFAEAYGWKKMPAEDFELLYGGEEKANPPVPGKGGDDGQGEA